MTAQPPINSQPPSRGKDPWRLRGVHRAEPHLGEENQSPRIVWAMVIGIVLILLIAGAVIFIRSRPPSVIPTSVYSPTPSSSPSPIATLETATPQAEPTNTSTAVTATAPRPTAPFVRYRVRAGDTLSEIAQKYNVTVRAIMQANGLRSETIIEGEELVIPIATPRAP